MNTENITTFCAGVFTGAVITCAVGFGYLKHKKPLNNEAVQHLREAGDALKDQEEDQEDQQDQQDQQEEEEIDDNWISH